MGSGNQGPPGEREGDSPEKQGGQREWGGVRGGGGSISSPVDKEAPPKGLAILPE